ncbi:hypothetical protein [Asaia astilbis]|uniref:hypothetical protein n=1 Tax=Asaia astilbis TaxID=610244 RepID=UPI00046FBEA0|nr:hypothetical protein [Asaia astilbis]
MPRLRQSLWIVFVLTFCLVLRGALPAQAGGVGCASSHHSLGMSAMPNAMMSGQGDCMEPHKKAPPHPASHGHGCTTTCLPSMSCISCFSVPPGTSFSASFATDEARFDMRTSSVLLGHRVPPDLRPPRTS